MASVLHMERVEALGRFDDGHVWHAVIDLDSLRTACGFCFTEADDDEGYELATPDLAITYLRRDLCGVCEDQLHTLIPAIVALSPAWSPYSG